MPGLTIREFTISTKVVSTNRQEKSKNQPNSGSATAFQNGSEYSHHKTEVKSTSARDQENIVRLCVDKVLEIIQQQEER